MWNMSQDYYNLQTQNQFALLLYTKNSKWSKELCKMEVIIREYVKNFWIKKVLLNPRIGRNYKRKDRFNYINIVQQTKKSTKLRCQIIQVRVKWGTKTQFYSQ